MSAAPHLNAYHVRVPLELFKDPRLTLTQLRVAGVLYAHANQAGVAWPSRRRISELTGIPSGRVAQATAGLQRLGWLVKEGAGGRRSATYTLSIPDLGQGEPICSDSAESVLPASAEGGLGASTEAALQNSLGNISIELPQPVPLETQAPDPAPAVGGGSDQALLEEHATESRDAAPQEAMPNSSSDLGSSQSRLKPPQIESPPIAVDSDSALERPLEAPEDNSELEQRKLHFPEQITDEQRFAMALVLSALSQAEAQLLLDELAGRMTLGGIRNPVGYLRGLVQAHSVGVFLPELASVAREARAAKERARYARKAAEARMDARLLGVGPTLPKVREVPTAALEAARAALST